MKFTLITTLWCHSLIMTQYWHISQRQTPPKIKKSDYLLTQNQLNPTALCVWSVLENFSIFTSHYTTGGVALSVCVFVFHRG